MKGFKAIAAEWKESENPIWLFSCLGIRRNIKNHKFPGKMSLEERRSMRAAIHQTLKKYPKFKSFVNYSGSELDPIVKDYFYEHFLSAIPLQHLNKGEGVCYERKGPFHCLLNYMDHIRLNYIDKRNDLFEMWKELLECELFLEKELGFAFNSRFGFVTSNPDECGSGIDIRIFLQLPALIYAKELGKSCLNQEIIGFESLEGGQHHFTGDLVVVKNKVTLGFKEEDLLNQMQKIALNLVAKEQSLKKKLKETPDPKLYDLVSRAFALLKHSYCIDMHEALNALGKIRLGLDLNWIKNISHKQLNKLLFASRRGHLCVSSGLESINPKEVSTERASFFRKAFKRVSFKE